MGALSSLSFLTPLALGLAALAVPIVLLYMLRLRRTETPISSTFLWQQLLRDREANAPWQRLRPSWLLLLQLLILAALVIALARPFIEVKTVSTGRTVLLLDASASMAATDVEPSRFEAGARDGAGDGRPAGRGRYDDGHPRGRGAGGAGLCFARSARAARSG